MNSVLKRSASLYEHIDRRFRAPEVDGRSVALLGALLALELIAFSVAKLPIIGRFELFLTMDYGGNLSLQRLLDQGLQPTTDFFYPYGLLPLLFGRVWFGLLGLTPSAYLAAVVFFHLAIGFGLARALGAFRVGLPGVLLMIVALPIMVAPTYANLCHALEGLFLILALGSQARGRHAEALAITTVALFSKPSMPYIYGAILTSIIVARCRFRPRLIVRELAPAAGTLVLLAAGIGFAFGFRPLLNVLIPVQMARIYQAVNFGFFQGIGRRFWLPPDAGVEHYLGTVRGLWIAATIVLTLAAVIALFLWLTRRKSAPLPNPAAEMIVTTAFLHWAFLSLFFGADISWLYYSYLLVLGVAAIAAWGKTGSRIVLILAALALAADRALPRELLGPWREVGLSPRILGLWTTPDVDSAWREVLAEVGDENPVFLSLFDNAGTLFPEFAPPVDFFIVPGMETMMGATAHARRIDEAQVVVLPGPSLIPESTSRFLTKECPAITEALTDFEPSGGNDYFTIYRRTTLSPD